MIFINFGFRDHPHFQSEMRMITETKVDEYHVQALYYDNWKVIINRGQELQRTMQKNTEIELYDLSSDWGEKENLSMDHPILAGYLAQTLRSIVGMPKEAQTEGYGPSSQEAVADDYDQDRLSDEVRDNLRALGYID